MSIGAVGSNNSMISNLLVKAMDQDKSGAASLDEFVSVGQSLPAGRFDQSEDALSKAYSELDSDGDGALTESEVAQGLARFAQESASALLGAQEEGPPPPSGGNGGGFFAQADADGSGSVSLEEFTSAGPQSVSSDDAETLFSEIDSDGDGEITSSEDETFRASLEGKGGPGGAGGPPPPPPGGGGDSASSDDEEDETSTLLAQLSELLSARSAYQANAATTSSFLDEATQSLFTSA